MLLLRCADSILLELQRDVVAATTSCGRGSPAAREGAASHATVVRAGAGSGLSDGAFVTLGYQREMSDASWNGFLVGSMSALALWGQSAGAAAAFYGLRHKSRASGLHSLCGAGLSI